MTSTSVGMRCPECAGEKTRVVNPVGAPGRNDAPATYAIIGLCVIAFIAEIASGGGIGGAGSGTLTEEGGMIAYGQFVPGETIGVAFGQPYRLVTAAFLHAGLLHIAFNMFALYILGTLLEPAIGTARFVGIYAVSVLSGSFLVMVMDPNQLTVGASGGVFGLMAAAFLIARNRGLDELASQIGFFVVINLVITFGVSNISIGGHIGGLVGGAVAALIVNQLDRSRIANARTIEYAVLIGLCVVAAIGGVVAAESSVPAVLS
jgi:membrane associated rhomboid family serine protease